MNVIAEVTKSCSCFQDITAHTKFKAGPYVCQLQICLTFSLVLFDCLQTDVMVGHSSNRELLDKR